MSVGKLGSETVVTTNRDSELSDVTETLDSENVGSIVITEDDEPVGMMTVTPRLRSMNTMTSGPSRSKT